MGCVISKKESENKPIQGSIYNIFRLLSNREPPRWRKDVPEMNIDEHLHDVVDVLYDK